MVAWQPFQLRSDASETSDRILHVENPMTVRKVKEINQDWWQVEVNLLDGSTKPGFGRRDWLMPQTVPSSFSPDDFAQTCLDVAARYGTTADLLIALADAETALANNASPNGLYFGPFAISESEWKAVNVPAETGFGDDGRFNP